jgi:hypothetical protein
MASQPKPNRVRNLEIPYKALVLRADPAFEQQKRLDPFYEFTGRTFREDTSKQGPYSTVPNKRD